MTKWEAGTWESYHLFHIHNFYELGDTAEPLNGHRGADRDAVVDEYRSTTIKRRERAQDSTGRSSSWLNWVCHRMLVIALKRQASDLYLKII